MPFYLYRKSDDVVIGASLNAYTLSASSLYGQLEAADNLDLALVLKKDGSAIREATTEEKTALALADAKAAKIAAIDQRTQELIAAGFDYDGASFSLSQAAQLNWTNLALAKDLLSYPISLTTKDDGAYEIESAGDVTAFYAAGVSAVKAALDSGRSLKVSVIACTTVEQVAGVEDNR